MSTIERLKRKYSVQLKRTDQFLSSNKIAMAKRQSYTQSGEASEIIGNKSLCITCQSPLTKGNLTVEHAHPISFGGLNNSENRFPICKSCNTARNIVMDKYLGGTGVKHHRQRWPTNRDSVENFLIWSIITVEQPKKARGIFSSLDDAFYVALKNEGVEIDFSKLEGNKFGTINDLVSNGLNSIKNRLRKNSSISEISCPGCPKTLRFDLIEVGDYNLRCPNCKIIINSKGEVIANVSDNEITTESINKKDEPLTTDFEIPEFESLKQMIEWWINQDEIDSMDALTFLGFKSGIEAFDNEKRGWRKILREDYKISNSTPPKLILKVLRKNKKDQLEALQKAEELQNAKTYNFEELENILFDILGNNSLGLNQLTSKFKEKMGKKGHEGLSTGKLLNLFGEQSGMKKLIENKLSDKIEMSNPASSNPKVKIILPDTYQELVSEMIEEEIPHGSDLKRIGQIVHTYCNRKYGSEFKEVKHIRNFYSVPRKMTISKIINEMAGFSIYKDEEKNESFLIREVPLNLLWIDEIFDNLIIDLNNGIRELSEEDEEYEYKRINHVDSVITAHNINQCSFLFKLLGPNIVITSSDVINAILSRYSEINEFPIVNGLNSGSSGLCLPRYPDEFVRCLTEYIENQNTIKSNEDIHDLFFKILKGRKRTERLVNNFASVLLHEKTSIKNRNWEMKTLIQDPIDFCKLLQNHLIEYILEKGMNLEEECNDYFNRIKSKIENHSS